MPLTPVRILLRDLLTRMRRRGTHVLPTPDEPPAPSVGSSGKVAPPSCLDPATPTEFHPGWYLVRYPDAAAAVRQGTHTSAADHYREIGVSERRDPNPFFRESWYRSQNPDVEAAMRAGEYRCGFDHFRRFGHAEHRLPNDLAVDEKWYLATHPEVAEAVARGRYSTAREHYQLVGCLSAVDPHAAFSESWYLETYPSVAREVASGVWLCGYQHFTECGFASGLKPHPDYAEPDYLGLYPDVDSAVKRGRWPSGYHQLIAEGLEDGRRWQSRVSGDETLQALARHGHVELQELLGSNALLDFTVEGVPSVSVVVVLFGRAELTLACLRALHATCGASFELIVVDNSSGDRTVELLARLRGATVIRNPMNLGFVRAANQGAEQARSPNLLFLNNDAMVSPGALAAALRRLSVEPAAAAVGGRVLRLDGLLQEAGCELTVNGKAIPFGGGEDPTSGAFLFPRPVDYCSGVFLMIRREVFEGLRGFDTRYEPAYCEDVDLCFRMRGIGWETWYEPLALIRHVGSASETAPWKIHSLVRRNQSILRHQHAGALAAAAERHPHDLLSHADRRTFGARALVLDDLLPLATEGSGAPRTFEILRALTELDLFVTFFCCGAGPWDPQAEARLRMMPGVELISHLGLGFFAEFWGARRHSYDFVVISRPHNLNVWVREGFGNPRARVVYDAEALVGIRKALQAEVFGRDRVFAPEYDLDWELELIRHADLVWAASVSESELMTSRGIANTRVTHAVDVLPGPEDLERRSGLLFVGRLSEPDTPNVDGLSWFIREVLPEVRQRLRRPVTLDVVGRLGAASLPEAEGVTYHGVLDDITSVMQRTRVAIAPLRFGAGHPFKVIHAASHGVPVVASPLALQQLGWTHNLEIVDGTDDPEAFARRTCALLEEEAQWRNVREGAIARVRRDYSRDQLRSAIADALGLQRREHTSDAKAEAPEIP